MGWWAEVRSEANNEPCNHRTVATSGNALRIRRTKTDLTQAAVQDLHIFGILAVKEHRAEGLHQLPLTVLLSTSVACARGLFLPQAHAFAQASPSFNSHSSCSSLLNATYQTTSRSNV